MLNGKLLRGMVILIIDLLMKESNLILYDVQDIIELSFYSLHMYIYAYKA